MNFLVCRNVSHVSQINFRLLSYHDVSHNDIMICDCIMWSLVNFHIDILHEMISLHYCLVCIMWWLKYWLMQSWCKSLNHWFLSFFLTLIKGEKVIASLHTWMKNLIHNHCNEEICYNHHKYCYLQRKAKCNLAQKFKCWIAMIELKNLGMLLCLYVVMKI